MSFNQLAPAVPTILNCSNCFVFSNSSTGNALSVQQLGAGNVFSTSNASGRVGLFVSATSNVGVGTTNPATALDVYTGTMNAATVVATTYYGVLAGSNTVSASTVSGTTITASSQFSGPGTGLTGAATSLTAGLAQGLTGTPAITVGTVSGTTITASSQFSGPGTGLTGAATSLTAGLAQGLTGTPAITVGTVSGTTITASSQFSGPGTGLTGAATSLSVGGSAGSLSTTYAAGRILYGAGSGVPTTVSTLFYDSASGRVGIGTTNPGSALQVGTADYNYVTPSTWQEYVIGTNGCIPNTSTGQGITGNMFVASSAAYARNKGGGICLGGRGADFGGGNQLMPFGRISGVQNGGTDGYVGDLVFEVHYAGNLYERARITNSGLGVTGTFSATSTKSFDIPHPSLENKRLVHACIEAPRVDLIYRNAKQLIDGTATVNIDRECTKDIGCAMTEGTFVALCINPQIFLQNMTGFDPVIGSISGNILTIRCKNTESNDTISWMVVAERHDSAMVSSNTATTNSDGYLITEYTPI